MLRKKECTFYYFVYRKFKNSQNEFAVIEFRRAITCGEEFAENGGGVLVNV